MKLAKLNHMSIITLFAIAFIVVYLYYTISDVKKIHSEVKRMGQDIDKLNQSITNITTSILPMLTFPSAAPAPTTAQYQPATRQQTQPQPQTQEQQDEDDASVGSHELTKIMETIDVEESVDADDVDESSTAKYNIDTTTSVVVEDTASNTFVPTIVDVQPLAATVDIGSLSAEDLKKVPYNDIRKFCKSNNIDDKGSKEVLIYRIKNPPRP